MKPLLDFEAFICEAFALAEARDGLGLQPFCRGGCGPRLQFAALF